MSATITKLVLAKTVDFWVHGKRITGDFEYNGKYCALGALAKSYSEITGITILDNLIIDSKELQPIIELMGYNNSEAVYTENDKSPSKVYNKMVKALEKMEA